MRTRLASCAVLAMLLVGGAAMAAEYTWQGINTESATDLSQNNVDDSTLWLDATAEPPDNTLIPTTGDNVTFNFNDNAGTGDFSTRLIIPTGASFAPSNVTVIADTEGDPTLTPIYFLKSMTLNSLTLNYASWSGGNQVIRIGTSPKVWSNTSAGYAHVRYYYGVAGNPNMIGTFNVAGNRGNKDYTWSSATTAANVASAINADTAVHGVKASSAYGLVFFYSEFAGATQFVKITKVSGTQLVPFTNYARGNVDGVAVYGMDTQAATLTLSGDTPLTLTGSRGSFENFWLAANSKLVFSGTSIGFQQATQSANGLTMLGITGETGSSVEFTGEAASIALPDPGTRAEGCLNVGLGPSLNVRSDQTWSNPSGLGFIRRGIAPSTTLIVASDSQPLSNMDEVNFYCYSTTGSTGANALTQAVSIPAGEYGGLLLDGFVNWNANYRVGYKLTGPASFKSYVVYPGNNTTVAAAADADYGLVLGYTAASYMGLHVFQNGQTLTVDHGLKLNNISVTTSSVTADAGEIILDACGSTLNIGGDLLITGTWNAGHLRDGVNLREERTTGINGDATTVINLGGSFKTNLRSLTATTTNSFTYNGLALSTLNLLGSGKTMEVLADKDDNFTTGTWCIGTLNIGDGTTAASITLVNESLNDNDASLVTKTKDGEVLLAKALNIKAGSTLDCAGLGVKLSSGGVTIAEDGWLDLHTGSALSPGMKIKSFYGVGDQTAAWDLCKARVKDSTPGNESLTFTPTYDSTDGVTYWMVAQTGPTGIISADSPVVLAPSSIRDNGTDKATLTITLLDTGGYPQVGKTAGDFVIAAGSATVTFLGETDPGVSGIYTAELTSTVAAIETVTVTASGTLLSTQPTLTVIHPVPVKGDSTVAASSTIATDDGQVTSTLTIYIEDAIGNPMLGASALLTLLDGGTQLEATFTEVGGGTYTVLFNGFGLTTGAHTLQVAFDYGGANQVILDDPADTKTVTVYTPGQDGYPLADASATTSPVQDLDYTSGETVLLDGSLSWDDVGITSYVWTYANSNGVVLTSGAEAVQTAYLSVGTHQITLTVKDSNNFVHTDTITVTVNPPEYEQAGTQLDISSGFNFDALMGWKESREIGEYQAAYDPDRNLYQLQGNHVQNCMYYLANQYGQYMLLASSTDRIWYNYGGTTTVTGNQGLPEYGIITGYDRLYHVPSSMGNTTFPGDWAQVDDPQYPPQSEVGVTFMANKPNAMVLFTNHARTINVTEATATLPEAQQGKYGTINFVLACLAQDDRARNYQIRAIYDDASEEVIYAFATADGGSGPYMFDYGTYTKEDPLGEFMAVYTSTRAYSYTTGSVGNIGSATRTLWEFMIPRALNPNKKLVAIKLVDTVPTLTYQPRGLAIFGATVTPAPEGTNIVDGDLSTVSINPAALPSDGVTTATITIELVDENGVWVTGLTSGDFEFTIEGDGNNVISGFTNPVGGIYTFTITSDTNGLKQISVTAGGVTLTDTVNVTVYTPPTADAGDDIVTNDVGNYTLVTLDGSGSSDDNGIVSYVWTTGTGTVLYSGANAVTQVMMTPGTYTVTLTVTDGDGAPGPFTAQDTVSITLNVKQYTTQPIALVADAYNVDTFVTPAEVTLTTAWYNYWLTADPVRVQNVNVGAWDDNGTPNDYSDDIWVPTYPTADALDRHPRWAFSPAYTEANTVMQGLPGGENTDEWYPGNDPHWHAPSVNMHHVSTWTQALPFRGEDGFYGAVQSVVLGSYAAYQLQPFDAGANIGLASDDKLTAAPNAIKLGTGAYTYNTDEAGFAERTVMLQTPARYSDVNFLLTGSTTDAVKRSFFRIIAIYEDLSEQTIFQSPYTVATEGMQPGPDGEPGVAGVDDDDNGTTDDASELGWAGSDDFFGYPYGGDETNPLNWIPHGVPSYQATEATWTYGVFNTVIAGWKYYSVSGAGTSSIPFLPGDGTLTTNIRFYEPSAEGLAVNPAKVLIGFRFEVDAGPNTENTGETYGTTVHIFAVSGTPASELPVPDAEQSEVTATTPVVADGVATSTITITVKDAEGTTMEGLSGDIVINVSGTNNTVSAVTEVGAGVYTATLSSTTAEVKTVTVTVSGVVLADQPTVTFTAPPLPELVITAGLDYDWVYPNTPVTTQNRHKSVLTVDITGGSVVGETYAITLGENGGAVTNFQTAASTPIVPGTPATVDILGGLRTTAVPGTYTINVTVTGTPGGQVATQNVTLKLRLLGDIVEDGIVNASDKLEMNKKLNGLANLPGITLRDLDLSGDGALVNAEDKLAINQVLNGLIVP